MSSSQELEVQLFGEVLTYARRELDAVVERCESPIERVLLAAMLRQFGAWPEIGTFAKRERPWTVPGMVDGEYPAARYARSDDARIVMVPQLPLNLEAGSFRLDFALLEFDAAYKTLVQCIALECDGHDFHDRTKEQASRDRARDRALQAAGWKVLRFTGRDIVQDPLRCADEAVGFVMPRAETPKAAPKKKPRVSTSSSVLLPGPATDALGLLIVFPAQLGNVADQEGLSSLLPVGPLSELARDLTRGPLPLSVSLERVQRAGDSDTLRRVADVVSASVPAEEAEREFLRACVKARLSLVMVEMGEAERRVVKGGPASVDDLSIAYQRLVNQKRELQRRLNQLERGDNA